MNETTNLNTSNPFYNGIHVWIACEASLILMTVVLLYICVCLAYFVSKEGKQTQTRTGRSKSIISESNRCDTISCSRRDDRTLSLSKTKRTLRAAMRYTCLLSALSTLLKLLMDQLKFHYAWNARSDEVCEAVYDATDIGLFYIAYMSVYAFLWIKQWLFYCDPVAAKFLCSKTIVIFSKVFVCIMFLLSLAVAIINLLPVRFKISDDARDADSILQDPNYLGCVSVYDVRMQSALWPLILYCTLNAVFQCTLMALFVYPLIWHRFKTLKNRNGSKPVLCCSASNNSSPQNVYRGHDPRTSPDDCRINETFGRRHQSLTGRILSRNAIASIQRTVFWTAVCIVTDATLVVIFAFLNVGTPMVLTAVASDMVLLTNVICIVATYKTWKDILFPFCGGGRLDKSTSTRKGIP